MKQAVIYGAGNIGRGFAAQLFSRSGYEICFVDLDGALVDALNCRGEYPLRILLEQGSREEVIRPVRALHGGDINAVSQAIARADIMATAVGAAALPHIAGPIAAGLARRFASSEKALDILLCENMPGAAGHMRGLIGCGETVGLVETAVGRMVPVQTEAMRGGDPLRLCVEEYAQLFADRAAFRGEIPTIEGLISDAPFAFYLERKLFIHNMGHAVAAYAGALRDYDYIWEAISDPGILTLVRGAMRESAAALCQKHGRGHGELELYIQDLLRRFGNRQLGDTIARVGRDLPRKLAEGDRLFGAAGLCGAYGVDCAHIRKGVAAALLFGDLPLEKLRRMADIATE